MAVGWWRPCKGCEERRERLRQLWRRPVYGSIGAPYWDDRPVAVVAGGPSLMGFEFERLRGCHVLAVKGTIFDIPWADAGFGLDMPRYDEWKHKLAMVPTRVYWAVPEEQLEKVGPPTSSNVTYLKRLVGENLSDDPGEIYGGGTSGFGAIQVCIHKRAKRIVLFGFDYDGAYSSEVGFRFNDKHYDKRRAQNRENWKNWARHFECYVDFFTQERIECWNACPASAVMAFPKCTLGDGVALVHGELR